jgi:HAD superfamily hydrolase (TIGR01509 family)
MSVKYSVLLDLDGVISNTALIHAQAWKIVFDNVLDLNEIINVRFDICSDYLNHIDGKSRHIGISDYLKLHSLNFPMGEKNSSDLCTIHGIGNYKNKVFRNFIDSEGTEIFPDAIRLMKELLDLKIKIGLSSSSKNARYILENAGLINYFGSIMDGIVADERCIASKPDPQFYEYAAKLIGSPSSNCIVIEDAISGVQSAKNAGIGLVIGISRQGEPNILRENGADIVVSSLDELCLSLFVSGIETGRS